MAYLNSDPQPPESGRSDCPDRLFAAYQDAEAWLHSHIDLERVKTIRCPEEAFKLNRMRELLDVLGNPQEYLQMVHVAGTKGKGSTVAMLSAILQGCNLTVGEYTSPHLVTLRERIRINGRDISEKDTLDLLSDVARAAKSIGASDLHYFEIMTAVGFLYFAHMAVDIAIIEVGLGGRLDSTNVISPLVCAITQISLDHMNLLGSTHAAIAREKGGIFKPGVPAVSAPQVPEAVRALREKAQEIGCPLRILDREIGFSSRIVHDMGEPAPYHIVQVITPDHDLEQIRVPLMGRHQCYNCGLALAVVDVLRKKGYRLNRPQIDKGLAGTRLCGRMETISHHPRIIIDGAHNAASMEALMECLRAHLQFDSLIVVFGCGKDKDIDGMLRAMARAADKVIITKTSNNPKATPPEALAARLEELSPGKMLQTAATLPEALELVKKAVRSQDLVVVTGSFYLIGELKRLYTTAAPAADHAAGAEAEPTPGSAATSVLSGSARSQPPEIVVMPPQGAGHAEDEALRRIPLDPQAD